MSRNDNILKPARPGDFLSATRDRKIIERVKGRITGRNVAETSNGFHLRREIDEDRILVINIDALDAPAFGLVEVSGYDVNKNRYEVRQPTEEDNANTFIVSDTDIAPGSEGYVFDDRGTHKLLVTGAVVAGDIVGSKILDWTAIPSSTGTYLVRAVSGGDVFAVPFRGAVPSEGVIPFASYQFVDDQTPDSVNGLPTTMTIALIVGDPPNDRIARGIAKFASPVVLSGLVPVSIVLATMRFYLARTQNFSSPGEGDDADGTHTINIFKIIADFDETTLTFNNYSSLTKSQIGAFTMRIAARGTGEIVFGLQSDAGAFSHPSWEHTLSISGTIFGLAFESSAAFTIGNRATHSFQVQRSSSTGGYIVIDPLG